MKWRSIFVSSLLPLNTLLLFLLLFDSRLVLPSWLQVLGRMHPVILHFPIVLVILYAAWIGWSARGARAGGGNPGGDPGGDPGAPEPIGDVLLLTAALSAAITAIMGLFLSREPGYEGSSIAWHKWMGALTSFGLLSIYYSRPLLKMRPLLSTGSAAFIMLITLIAGHLGGTITHGENFVLGPVLPANKRPAVPLEEAMLYKDLVAPILESKCTGCHNADKAKGGLVLESREAMLKGGKDGKLWDTTQADLGLLMSRIHLPLEDKKHMPPASKSQLTGEEGSILYSWIKEGAPFDKRVMELSLADTLRALAAAVLKSTDDEQYVFAAADEKKIQSLNTNYRTVQPIAKGSPALAVDFYGKAAFHANQLKELAPVREQVVSLNLEKMPVTDKDLPLIADFANLRVLNLGFTNLTGAGVGELLKLSKLKSLTLSGTAVGADDIRRLTALKDLHHLYVWNTKMSPNDLAVLQKTNHDHLVISTGFRSDTVLIKLNAPILQTEDRIVLNPVLLQLKHYVPGVTIRYTLDGRDPDSVTSPVYNDHVYLNTRSILKARAFKPGWLGSDPVTADFFGEAFRPDSIVMLKPIDSAYMKYGPKILIDLKKGDLNFGSGKWLGFHKNPMEGLIFFNKPVNAQLLTLSSLVDIGSDIMPPVSIEVWGGRSARDMKLLGHINPEQPRTAQIAYLAAYDIRFPPTSVRCLKIVVVPVSKLPDWQVRKGKPGWIMEDEIFVN
ncbi:MAG: c-type cytochrome domain-containing protein [Bacteroidota bacterium]|nr:c-type cytochrome domain-containing protein [Bacteroidota bacterium]